MAPTPDEEGFFFVRTLRRGKHWAPSARAEERVNVGVDTLLGSCSPNSQVPGRRCPAYSRRDSDAPVLFAPRVWVWIALPATQQASLPATLSGSVRPFPQNAFFPGVKPRFVRNGNTVRRAAGAFTERRQSAKLSRLRRRSAHANGLSRSSRSFASGWIRLPADDSQLTTDPVPTAVCADSGFPAAQGTRHEDLISGGLAPVSADDLSRRTQRITRRRMSGATRKWMPGATRERMPGATRRRMQSATRKRASAATRRALDLVLDPAALGEGAERGIGCRTLLLV
ncbi:hypothetical protein C8J57DRAFT_1479397 [Mycena rebaudengoi]|nr:hypothetical protein C8J57DRAFT_1479397 [Mycena rebaudengoi]